MLTSRVPQRRYLTFFVLLACLCVASSRARGVPWILFEDVSSGELCDVVNAANAELVVLASTGQLVVVNGPDAILTFTFVDDTGDFYLDGIFSGFVEFATDGDGLRGLWLFTLVDDVANINVFTGEITQTGLLPDDFIDAPCDACLLWDDPNDCVDSDFDGVDDRFDLCDGTPFDELPDIDGCSCSQLDSDLDGVIDCWDFCADTPEDLFVDLDGCSCLAYDDDDDGIDNCDDLCPDSPIDEVVLSDGCACVELDSDLDGINDCFDLCYDTPDGFGVDEDGCSCLAYDDDDDGVDNCDDLCPQTRSDDLVDVVGCVVGSSGGGSFGVIVCGNVGLLMPLFLCGGLLLMRERRPGGGRNRGYR